MSKFFGAPQFFMLSCAATMALAGCKKSDQPSSYEYVDLGLSVKWATCNVGATKPEESGDFFAWGETTSKANYDWDTYAYCTGGSRYAITKYCDRADYGNVDNKTTLEMSDDAARVNWGGNWRMPTGAEIQELADQCTWTWTTQNGVGGCKVTGSNGNSIFLPAAGYMDKSEHIESNAGSLWSSSLEEGSPDDAYNLNFNERGTDFGPVGRENGFNIRAVIE